jgi:ParB-like chromosome segregation protein Spo0J
MHAPYTERALKDGREKRKKSFEDACGPKQPPIVLDDKPPLPQKLNTSREVREWQDVALQLREQLEQDGKIRRIAVNAIVVGKRLRPITEGTIAPIMESIKLIGQLMPISVHIDENCKTMRLVTGAHRVEAMKRLGFNEIDAVFVTGDEVDLELHGITENLHRAELTPLEHDVQVARWIELTTAKREVSSQPETKPQGGRPTGGINAASRELGLSKSAAHRAVKVAGISDQAKQAARDAGLDKNRTALLEVAKETTPEKQIAKVTEIAEDKTMAKAHRVEPAVPDQLADATEKVDTSPVDTAIAPREACLIVLREMILDEWLPKIPKEEYMQFIEELYDEIEDIERVVTKKLPPDKSKISFTKELNDRLKGGAPAEPGTQTTTTTLEWVEALGQELEGCYLADSPDGGAYAIQPHSSDGGSVISHYVVSFKSPDTHSWDSAKVIGRAKALDTAKEIARQHADKLNAQAAWASPATPETKTTTTTDEGAHPLDIPDILRRRKD